MKKLFAVLASIFVAASAYGVTNSTLIDFAITGNADNLQPAGDDTNEVVSVQQNLYNDNWVVWLNESARLTENRRNSYAEMLVRGSICTRTLIPQNHIICVDQTNRRMTQWFLLSSCRT